MPFSDISQETLIKGLYKTGRRGQSTLAILGKYRPFIDAMESDIGCTLLADLIASHDALLDKIASIEATDEEKAEYKVTKNLIYKWSDRIATYYGTINQIKKNAYSQTDKVS